MSEKRYKYGWLKKLLVTAVPIILILSGVFFYYNVNRNNFNKNIFNDEFVNGSNIVIDNLESNEVESLNKLCKVWGFVKYYHPSAINGSIDMDFELFRVMPKVLEARSQKAVNRVLYD